jgi:hypothetical protein
MKKLIILILFLSLILIIIFSSLSNHSFAQSEDSSNEFKIISVIPPNGTKDVPIDFNIMINFNKPVNKSSVEKAISIDPEILNNIFKWNDNSTSLIIDHEDLYYDTKYTLVIGKSAESMNEENLNESYISSFTTTWNGHKNRIFGIVTDQNGIKLSKVFVTFKGLDNDIILTAITDDNGNYLIETRLYLYGKYRVIAEKEGFQKYENELFLDYGYYEHNIIMTKKSNQNKNEGNSFIPAYDFNIFIIGILITLIISKKINRKKI